MNKMAVYGTVFITGAAVMVIELLGTRLIAPFYGTSLYVWASLLSVTMMALAIGYFVGGAWADRGQGGGLSLIIGLSGMATLLIPWINGPVLLATDPMGLKAGSFVSALVLFFPSLTLLGMVSPFAIKKTTAQLNSLGAGAGSIYGVSTVGSVTGTIVLAFFLFPVIGSREILFGLGLTLIGLSLIVSLFDRKGPLAFKGMGIHLTVMLLLGWVCFSLNPHPSESMDKPFRIVSERESLYGWVRVIDQPDNDLRLLTSDASVIGAEGISDRQNRLTYQQIVSLMPLIREGMSRALLVGQGAGHMAMALWDRSGISVDTIEIDPEVATAATSYFGFKPHGQTVVGDGRYSIRKLKGPYDLIIHDCFTGGSEPTHLLTEETLRQLKGLLKPHGLLAVNFVSFLSAEKNKALASVVRTTEAVFSHHKIYRSEVDKDFNDFIVMASDDPIDTHSFQLSSEMKAWLGERETVIDSSKGTLLTDNFNPLESLQLEKSETYRNTVVSWFGSAFLVR